ncbi:growth-regulating factor 5-like [Rosa rugosa]|uniref:growth-regulating factor 5-like n=1 Tax=Rosa rugosa TaxID=74645 RepID=UPI002B4156AB|nr:growth-regulating factor 5-like [Rosa rugosa]
MHKKRNQCPLPFLLLIKSPELLSLFSIVGSKMMSGGNPSSARNYRYPFTATQWQELEHQALIFKYMVSGVPIPTDLVYSFKRRLDSSISSRLFPHHPFGWGCYDMGFGRKIDPEPGRCRRTDGKKWRCSKEAYPDSKYCERHMHRGRNRSRKPVEASSSSSTTKTTPNNNNTIPTPPEYNPASIQKNLSKTSPSMFSSSFTNETPHTQHQSSSLYPFLSRPQGSGTNPQLFLNSGSYVSEADHRDYRYLQGTKEGVDHELAFFPAESSANARSLMSSYKGYSSQSQFQSLTDHYPQQQSQDEQHCYVLGTDFKSSRPIKTENKEADQTQKSLHHFFGDWPPKSTDTWLDLAPNSRLHNDG